MQSTKSANKPAPGPATPPQAPADSESAGASREQVIRQLAYEFYVQSGCADGNALADWLRAEAEIGKRQV